MVAVCMMIHKPPNVMINRLDKKRNPPFSISETRMHPLDNSKRPQMSALVVHGNIQRNHLSRKAKNKRNKITQLQMLQMFFVALDTVFVRLICVYVEIGMQLDGSLAVMIPTKYADRACMPQRTQGTHFSEKN